jgi:phytoene desaturase
MARIAVVGGGVGGLCAATHLSLAGHDVTVYEKNASVGGKLASTTLDEFHFDTGPSLLTLPDTFRHLGIDIEFVRLSHPFRYTFADGTSLDVYDDKTSTQDAFEMAAPSGGRQWSKMYEHGERVWQTAERSFFSGAMYPFFSLLRRFRSPFDLMNIDPMHSLAQRGEKLFDDARLRQWFNRYATYSGSSPWRAPATLSCIPYIEQRYGCWYIPGGLARLAESLERTAKTAGAQLVTNAEVEGVHAVNREIRAITVNGERLNVDVVVANADAEHVYSDLFPHPQRRARVRQAGRSSSGFSLFLGLSGRTPNLTHHSVWFSQDQRREFEQIFAGSGVADDPTIYACVSSVTDASQAPENCENWNVLVNVGAGVEQDWDSYADRIIERLGIADRIMTKRYVTPTDLAEQFRSPGGAIYGSSSNSRRSAFLRADNRGPAKGLYLVGGSAHPGGGLPLVAMSGQIVAKLIEDDKPWE